MFNKENQTSYLIIESRIKSSNYKTTGDESCEWIVLDLQGLY